MDKIKQLIQDLYDTQQTEGLCIAEFLETAVSNGAEFSQPLFLREALTGLIEYAESAREKLKD